MPLVHWSQKFNAHVLHIPWRIYVPLYWYLAAAFLAISLMGCVILLWRSRGGSARGIRDAAYYSLLMVGIGTLLFVFSLGTGHDWRLVQRYGALRRLEGIHYTINLYKTTHDGQWPGDFETFVNDLHILNYSGDREKVNFGEAFGDIASCCDYAYLGDDLTDTPELKKEARRILVFLGKVEMPEISEVVKDVEREGYQYLYAGRPAVFADGRVRFVMSKDLGAVLAEHNAARDRLGLGAQSVCE